MTKKRIIFFSRDHKIGGMEKALVLLLNRLSEMDCYSIRLVLERKEGPLLSTLNETITIEEYRLSSIKNVLFRKLSNYLHRLCWTLKNKNRYSFSCNYATYSTICSRLAEIASDNSALYVHSDYYNYFGCDETKIKSFFDMQGIKKMKHIIFVSNESEENLKKVYPEYGKKFSVVSNLIDQNNILEKSAETVELKKDSEKQTIVFVGRLDNHSKCLLRLLESFKIVCEKAKDYLLLIIGDGADRGLCEEYIQKHDLGKYIKMIGESDNPYPYMRMANALILTSDYEGFPVVYNESLVLKVPIITTIPVSDKYLNMGDYSVITPKDAKCIARELANKSYLDITFNDVDLEKVNQNRIEDLLRIIND